MVNQVRKRIAYGALALFFTLWSVTAADARGALDQRRLSVVLFPTENNTDLQVWESKYYPYSVLEQKMTEYLAALLSDSAMVDAEVLDENGMNRWLAQPRRDEDMAVQLELYGATLKERQAALGKVETGSVKLRVKIFGAFGASEEPLTIRLSAGKDKRYTFDPGEDKLFWINAKVMSIPFDGLDLLGLTQVPYKGQRMSRPTWQQFSGTSHWQVIKNAVKDAYHEVMSSVSTVLKRNGPDTYNDGAPPFSPFAVNVGRIISPTADSTRRKREYVISIGREDALRVGDVLDVVRSDTYVSVDPENPVAVVPKSVGKVRVTALQERTAVVRVIKDDKKEPIQLTDLVMKLNKPELLEMDWGSRAP